MRKTYKTPKIDENQPLKISGVSFSHYTYGCVDTDYDYETHCDEDGCNDICRCRTISNARVTKVNVQGVLAKLVGERQIPEIDRYCAHRILTINKVYSPDNWNVGVEGGYYGQEIGDVTLDSKVAEKIDRGLHEVWCLKSNRAKIEYVLELEYGCILEKLEGCTYEIDVIGRSLLTFQQEHYIRLDQEAVASYKDYDLPRGICLADGDRYRLIDGYHRVSGAIQTKPIKMIVARNPKENWIS
jgi:hypothetical protein